VRSDETRTACDQHSTCHPPPQLLLLEQSE
jgi:hypothetical protein